MYSRSCGAQFRRMPRGAGEQFFPGDDHFQSGQVLADTHMSAKSERDMAFGVVARHVEFHRGFEQRLVVVGGEILQQHHAALGYVDAAERVVLLW